MPEINDLGAGDLPEITDYFPEEFIDLLRQDGFIIFVSGGKEYGKTNLSMLLTEVCFYAGLRKHFATNIHVESYFIKQIDNLPDLKEYLEKTKGKKTFIMDELGKILKRLGFATKKNKELMDILQLIRHYDCGFIGNAPSSRFVDSNFMDSDILDAHIKKISKSTAKVTDRLHRCTYFINDLPKTSILHNSKDVAIFNMEKRIDLSALKECCQAARHYGETKSLAATGRFFNPVKEPEAIRRLIFQHLNHES